MVSVPVCVGLLPSGRDRPYERVGLRRHPRFGGWRRAAGRAWVEHATGGCDVTRLTSGTEFDRRASALTHANAPLADACRELDSLLRRHVPYAAAAWSTHDPATGLSTSCTLTGVSEDNQREAAIFRHEFDDDEPATYLKLITEGRDIAVLSEETDGDVMRAGRFREVFAGFGVTDELRAILWAREHPWGSISLYRMGGRFTPDEAAFVAERGPVVADVIRMSLLRSAAARPEAVADPPGILQVERDGQVRPLTEPAGRWLTVAGPVLATAARSAASAMHERPDWEGARSRVVTDTGRVLTLHAAHTLQSEGAVAVIVEAARPAAVGAMLVDAYGVTPRQRDVLGLLLLGRSMTQVARALGISEHTANDHRKAIYERVGVSSRSELAAMLQSEQYDPHVHAGVPPSPYGGFLVSR